MADNQDDFTDWLTREMPVGTVIGDPAWWAARIAARLRGVDAVSEKQKASRDAMLTGTGFMLNGKRVNPEDVQVITNPVAGEAYNDDLIYGLRFIVERQAAVLNMTANPSEHHVVQRTFERLALMLK